MLAHKMRRASQSADFPAIAGTPLATTHSGAGTSRNIDLPTGIALNDLVIIVITTANSTAVTFTPPSGFTAISGAASSSTVCNGAAFYKFCNGTETGTITCTVSSSTSDSTATATRISGADTATAPTATAATGTSNQPNPPNHTAAWGVEKNLWMAAFGKRASSGFVSYPISYSLGQVGDNNNDVRTNSAAREVEASSENPNGFTTVASVGWHAITIAIKPA